MPLQVELRATQVTTPRVNITGTTDTVTQALAGTTSGRLLVATLGVDKSAGSITASAGWTVQTTYLGTSVSGAIATKTAAGGTESITWTVGTPNGLVADMVQTNLTTPAVQGTPTATAVDENSVTAKSLDLGTTGSETHVVLLAGVDSSNVAYTGAGDPVFSGITKAFDTWTGQSADTGGAGGAVALGTFAANAARSFTVTTAGADQQFLAAAAFTGTLASAAPTIVGYPILGGVTASGAVVAAKLSGATTARLATSSSNTMTSPTLGAAVTPDARGLVKLPSGTLPSNSQLYWQIEADSVLIGSPRAFRTSTSGLASLRVAFSACRNPATGADPTAWDRIAARAPDLFCHLGDTHYRDISSTNETLYHDGWDEVTSQPRAGAVLGSTDCEIILSDHDFCGNGSHAGSTGAAQARAAYHKRVPYAGLAANTAEAGGGGWYRTRVKNGVRIIVLDTRSYRSNPADADGPSKTMLGSAQETWLLDLLPTITEPVTLILSAEPWIPGGTQDDHWGSYPTAQSRLTPALSAAPTHVVWLCGDAHMVAADDGTNTPGAMATGGAAVLHGASLASNPSTKGGPYSQGSYAGANQYAVLDLTLSGSVITASYAGYDSADTARITLTQTIGATAPPEPIATLAIPDRAPGGGFPRTDVPALVDKVNEVALAVSAPTLTITAPHPGTSVHTEQVENLRVAVNALRGKVDDLATGLAVTGSGFADRPQGSTASPADDVDALVAATNRLVTAANA